MLLQSTQRPVSALHVAELAAGVSHSRRLLGAGGVVLCDVACVNDYLVTVYMKQPHMNKCKYGARLVLWGSRFRASYCMLASVCVCVHATALVVICNNSTAVDSNTLCDKSGFRLGAVQYRYRYVSYCGYLKTTATAAYGGPSHSIPSQSLIHWSNQSLKPQPVNVALLHKKRGHRRRDMVHGWDCSVLLSLLWKHNLPLTHSTRVVGQLVGGGWVRL